MSRTEELRAELKAELLRAEKRTDAILTYLEKKLTEGGKELPAEEDMFTTVLGALFGKVELEVLLLQGMRHAKGLWKEALGNLEQMELTPQQLEMALADVKLKLQEGDNELRYQYGIIVEEVGDTLTIREVPVEQDTTEQDTEQDTQQDTQQ